MWKKKKAVRIGHFSYNISELIGRKVKVKSIETVLLRRLSFNIRNWRTYGTDL